MSLQIVRLDPKLHDRKASACGAASLDVYLQKQAGQHQRDGIATTHLLVDGDVPAHILGYVSLAAAQAELEALQPTDRKRLPSYPVPGMPVGRLAVAKSERGRGFGSLLLAHAVNTALRLRSQLGVRILIVDALDESVVDFYRAYGFRLTAT